MSDQGRQAVGKLQALPDEASCSLVVSRGLVMDVEALLCFQAVRHVSGNCSFVNFVVSCPGLGSKEKGVRIVKLPLPAANTAGQWSSPSYIGDHRRAYHACGNVVS